MTLEAAIARLVERRDLDAGEMSAVAERLLDGTASPAQVGALLVALRMKGETVDELAGTARVLRARAVAVPGVPPDAIDTCGPGGDGQGTFNVSTAAALVVAACGVPVAKHGNRAVTSRTGSADVLEALGVAVELGPEALGRCVREVGIAFLYAPALHPALKRLGPARREIGVRTILNLAGPLANPAGVRRQVVGVCEPRLVDLMAGALARLGCERAWVVLGPDGFDEVGLSGPSMVAEVVGDRVTRHVVSPADAGIDATAHDARLAAASPAESAARILAVLAGERGPARDVVCLNAAAALVVAGAVPELRAGVARAAGAIDGGAARVTLERLAAFTRAEAER